MDIKITIEGKEYTYEEGRELYNQLRDIYQPSVIRGWPPATIDGPLYDRTGWNPDLYKVTYSN